MACADYSQAGGALNRSGFMYIIQEENTDYYKVGVSDNAESMMRNLKGGNWRKLVLKWSIEVSNMNFAEQAANSTLKRPGNDVQHMREGGDTEWFEGPYESILNAVRTAARKYPLK